MAQSNFYDAEGCDCSAWHDAVVEVSPELMPETLPPEFSPMPAFPAPTQRQRRSTALQKTKRS